MRAYQNMVYTTAIRLLSNEADALDVSQEAFLKAYEHFGELQANPAAGGWLKKVTTNLCLNHLTRYRARWRFFSEMFSPEAPHELDELLTTEPVEVEDTTRHEQLEKALRRLPSAQRVPLVLYHFEEISYEQIAQQLGVSLSKVKTDIHRGRQALRRWLGSGLAKPDSASGNRAGEGGGDSPWLGHFRLARDLLLGHWGSVPGEGRR